MSHISEIASERVRHPSDLLAVGQKVEIARLRAGETGNPNQPQLIALSLRALSKHPRTDAARQYRAGTRVKGKVTRIQAFGAFVESAPRIEGLVHVSELGNGLRVTHPNEILNAGEEAEATMLGVEPDRRRTSLSLDPHRLVTAEPVPQDADYAKPSEGMGTLGDVLRQSLSRAPGQGRSQSEGKRRPH